MINVIVCTHGTAGKGLIQSTEMICGQQKHLAVISYKMGETTESLRQQINESITSFESLSEIFILTDVKGGTPFNVMVDIIRNNPRYCLISGVNLPMLLELFINRKNMTLDELADKVIDSGKNGIYKYIFTNNDTDDDF